MRKVTRSCEDPPILASCDQRNVTGKSRQNKKSARPKQRKRGMPFTRAERLPVKRRQCQNKIQNKSCLYGENVNEAMHENNGNALRKLTGASTKSHISKQVSFLSDFSTFLLAMKNMCKLQSLSDTFNIELNFRELPASQLLLSAEEWPLLEQVLSQLSCCLLKLQQAAAAAREAAGSCSEQAASVECSDAVSGSEPDADAELAPPCSPVLVAHSDDGSCPPVCDTPSSVVKLESDISVTGSKQLYSAEANPSGTESQQDITPTGTNNAANEPNHKQRRSTLSARQVEITAIREGKGTNKARDVKRVSKSSKRAQRQASRSDSDAEDEPDDVEATEQEDGGHQFLCTNGCKDRTGAVRGFHSQKSLRMHQAAAHGQRVLPPHPEYSCPLCESAHKRPGELAQHLASCTVERLVPPEWSEEHDSADLVVCLLCHSSFPEHRLLREHSCSYATAGPRIQELVSGGALTASGPSLSRLRRFLCHQCGEEFRAPDMLLVHRRFCTPPPYPCHLCTVVCQTGRERLAHLTKLHSGERRLFPCPAPDCRLSFLRRNAFQKHLLKRHSSRGPALPLACDSCGKRFIRKIYLTHHKMRYHHDTLQRNFVCDVCGARLGTAGALQVHIRSVHEKPRISCHTCAAVFSRPDALLKHVRIKHTGERPHQCPLCAKSFPQQCTLSEHLRRHRGERRFRCVVCARPYAAAGTLRDHLRRVHRLELPRSRTVQPVAQMLRPIPDTPDSEKHAAVPAAAADASTAEQHPQEPPESQLQLTSHDTAAASRPTAKAESIPVAAPTSLQPAAPTSVQEVQLATQLAAPSAVQMAQVQVAPPAAVQVAPSSAVELAAPGLQLRVLPGRNVVLIPVVDPCSGAAAFYSILNQ